MDEQLKRNIIVGIVCFAIGALVVWMLMPPKVVTKTETKTVVQKEYVDRFIYRVYNEDTGNLSTETITDRSHIDTSVSADTRFIEKSAGTTFIITAGYAIVKGQGMAGAGVTLLSHIDIQVINPVALAFEPTVLLSLRF